MNAYQTYRQTQAQTAAPGELVLMLYRGAVRFVGLAIEGIESRDVQLAHTNLIKAQACISELFESLDVERGGEIALNLRRIYDYMNFRLREANLHKQVAPAREVDRMLRELLPAWEDAVRQTATSARPALAGVA